MTPTTRRLLAFAIVSIAANTLACTRAQQFRSEDENPIRVRNKVLHFDTEGRQSFWKKDNQNPRRWRLKKNGHSTTVFEVIAFGTNDSGCFDPLKAERVEVTFALAGSSDRKTFVFSINNDEGEGNEPVVDTGDVAMTEDHSGHTKRLRIDGDPQGAIEKIKVTHQSSTRECSFPGDRRVLIELCRNQCS